MARLQVFDGVFRKLTLPDPGMFTENIILFPTVEQDGTRRPPITVYGFIEAVEADSRDFESMYGLLAGESRVIGSVDYLRRITFKMEGFDPYNFQTLKIPSFAWKNFAWDVIAHEQPFGTDSDIHSVFAALGFEDPEDAADNRFGGWDRKRIGKQPNQSSPPAGQPGNSPGETIVNPPDIVVPPSFAGPANEYGSWPHPTVAGFTAVYRRRILAGLPQYHHEYDTLWWMDGAWRYYLEDRTIPLSQQPVTAAPIAPSSPTGIARPNGLVRPGEAASGEYANPYDGWVLRVPDNNINPPYRWRAPHDEATVNGWRYYNYDPFVNPAGVTTHFENIGGVFYSYNVDDSKPYWICSVPVTQLSAVPYRGTEGVNVFRWNANAYFLFDPQYPLDAPEQANTSITLYPPLGRALVTPAPTTTAFYLYPEIVNSSILDIDNRADVIALQSSGWAFRNPALQPITGVTHETRVIVPQVGTQVAAAVELERIMKIYHPNAEVTPHANSYYFEYNPLGNFNSPSELPADGGVPPAPTVDDGDDEPTYTGTHGFYWEHFNEGTTGDTPIGNDTAGVIRDEFVNAERSGANVEIYATPQTESGVSFGYRVRVSITARSNIYLNQLRDVMHVYYPGADYVIYNGYGYYEYNPFGFFDDVNQLVIVPEDQLILPEAWTLAATQGPPVAPEEDDGEGDDGETPEGGSEDEVVESLVPFPPSHISNLPVESPLVPGPSIPGPVNEYPLPVPGVPQPGGAGGPLVGWHGASSLVSIQNRYTVRDGANTFSHSGWAEGTGANGVYFNSPLDQDGVTIWLTKSNAAIRTPPTYIESESNNWGQRTQTLESTNIDLSMTARVKAGAFNFELPYSASGFGFNPPADPDSPSAQFRALYFNWGAPQHLSGLITRGDYLQIWYPASLGTIRGICHFDRTRGRLGISTRSALQDGVYDRDGNLTLPIVFGDGNRNPTPSYNYPGHAPAATTFNCRNFRWADSGALFSSSGLLSHPAYNGEQAGYNLATDIMAPVVNVGGQNSVAVNLNVLSINRAYLDGTSNWATLWQQGMRLDRNGDSQNLVCLMFDRENGIS